MDSFNYFNYFTEIEEYFWRKRGAHLLVSPLDWAIVETWQRAGIPLDAVLRGIDSAFESYQRSRRAAGRPLKSLAYCVDAVLDAAAQQTGGGGGRRARGQAPRATAAEPFSRDELRAFSPPQRRNASQTLRDKLQPTDRRTGSHVAQARERASQRCTPLLDSPGAARSRRPGAAADGAGRKADAPPSPPPPTRNAR